jgi:hypothetical protein
MRGIHRIATVNVLLLVAFAASASAQVLSAPGLSNASSPNEATASSANPSYQRFSNTSTLGTAPLTFSTRYFGNVSADCGPACTVAMRSCPPTNTVSWTATAPNIYSLSIATRRTAGLTIGDDGSNGAQAVMGALACTPSGGYVTSGGLHPRRPADNTSGTSTGRQT